MIEGDEDKETETSLVIGERKSEEGEARCSRETKKGERREGIGLGWRDGFERG